MRKDNRLRVGDWFSLSENIKEGKFQFGKIVGYKVKYYDINLNETEISEEIEGSLDGEGYVLILNKNEIDKLLKSKIKLEVIKGLR
jgi:hypothetical protein